MRNQTYDGNLATYEGQYPVRLFNKGVRTKDEDHLGHVAKETEQEVIVFGHHNSRFDIPKVQIITAGRNVIVNMTYEEASKYLVDRREPMPL